MVKVRDDQPTLADGRLDLDGAVGALCSLDRGIDQARLTAACRYLREEVRNGEALLSVGLALGVLIAELGLGTDAVLAGVLYRALHGGHVPLGDIEARFGAGVSRLIAEVHGMAAFNLLELSTAPLLARERRDQADNVRRMLVALIGDARVAVLKIAERIVALRLARRVAAARQQRIAREALAVYSPLANRLGIWRLKWELEDLAFRYESPDEYRRVAARLDGRRTEREREVAQMVDLLRAELAHEGIEAKVEGRAKHIFSIWRKMLAKGVDFSEVYDVRAVRVLVDDVRDCYAVLGIIHTRWRHVPSEFDDYVANPKDNGYRSIHTAVVGPDRKTLEVQIRTVEMHREAQLGVCAHWSYKDTGDTTSHDSGYGEKLDWLRQVLEWHDELGGFSAIGDEVRESLDQQRIYVMTPAGHVLDLVVGATPIDFAYRVHTEIGHRCRGAKVDGEIVALDVPLKTGQRVEVITGDAAVPLREWLDPHCGFVRTARAKAKIQGWFRNLAPAVNVEAGRELLTAQFARLAIAADLGDLARSMGFPDEAGLALAVSVGERSVIDVVAAADESTTGADQLSLMPLPADCGDAQTTAIHGAGSMPVASALCCRPKAGSDIIGVATSDVIIVHRTGCATVAAARRRDVVVLRWHDDGYELTLDGARQRGNEGTKEVHRVRVTGYDRPGLLHDITALLAEHRVSLVGTQASTDQRRSVANIDLEMEVGRLSELARIIDGMRRIPGVIDARRHR